jgi:hypothetical protein
LTMERIVFNLSRRTSTITRSERKGNHCPTATRGLAWIDWFVDCSEGTRRPPKSGYQRLISRRFVESKSLVLVRCVQWRGGTCLVGAWSGRSSTRRDIRSIRSGGSTRRVDAWSRR